MHREYTELAACAGLHVLCEKPMAVTSADCERMIQVTRQHDVRLMIAYRLHFERGISPCRSWAECIPRRCSESRYRRPESNPTPVAESGIGVGGDQGACRLARILHRALLAKGEAGQIAAFP